MKRAAYFATAMALTAILAGPAWARIGVTSVTDGTTSAVQGTDLQAGQHITTGPDGRAHLLFIDGSAVTVGPNSALRIDSYSYDPASKTGAMTLEVQKGIIRFVGGAISKKADVQIRTPSSIVGIRGGIAAVSVSESGATSADFLHGSAMRVTAGGLTQTATRSGSQVNVPTGRQPALPTVLASGQLANVRALDRAPANAPLTNRATGAAVDTAIGKAGLGSLGPTLPRQPSAAVGNMALSTPAQQARHDAQSSQIRLIRQQSVTSPVAAPQVLASAPAIRQSPPPAAPVPAGPVAGPPRPPTPPVRGGTTVSGATFSMSSGTLTLSGTNTYSGSGTISGTGTLTKSGTDTVTFVGK
ncbi:hypothetical protein RSO01_31020 [Reyranella soli]|uniref:FecR protein domain-containing protein n=1 Tax=Reyranella soli TaxID=1230389 RepID=A0A512NAD0_9HYPH|nr:hypothetical protein RSO01_31020 [Reyranella soli]